MVAASVPSTPTPKIMVTAATTRLLEKLPEPKSAPRTREGEKERAKKKWQARETRIRIRGAGERIFDGFTPGVMSGYTLSEAERELLATMWLVAVPIVVGALLGRLLDRRFDSGITWAMAGLSLGVLVGGYALWRLGVQAREPEEPTDDPIAPASVRDDHDDRGEER